MFSVKKILLFLAFFLTFGIVLGLLDLFTGYKYGISSAGKFSWGVARTRVARVFKMLRRGWYWSPVLFLAFLFSPILFVAAFVLAFFDCFSSADVFYTSDGAREVYKTGRITLEDVEEVGILRRLFGTRIPDGIYYQGAPIPKGWIQARGCPKDTAEKAQVAGWRTIEVDGMKFFAPPLDKDQQAGLEEHQDD